MGEVDFVAGKRMDALKWLDANEAVGADLAFDHGAVISSALDALRAEVQDLNFPVGLLPATFTQGELQLACEKVLGRSVDKSSFRRRLADKACLQAIPGKLRTGANRPAQVYRLC